MLSENFDFRQFHHDTITELTEATPPRQDMLNEVRESLRGLRESLNLYEEIAGPQRAALHRDTLNEHTALWKEYSNDNAGLFEDSDIINLVAQVRASNMVQSIVFYQYGTGKTKAHADTKAAQRNTAGCMVFAFLALPTIAGAAWWLI